MDKPNNFGNIKKFDEEFYQTLTKYRLNENYLFLNPDNFNEEKDKFLINFKSKKKYNPNFSYNREINKRFNQREVIQNIKNLHSKLNKIEFLKENLFLKKIYLRKISEALIFTNLINSINKKEFTLNSIKAYGKPKSSEFLLAQLIIKMKNVKKYFLNKNEKKISKQEISNLFKKYIESEDLNEWRLIFSKNILSVAVTICKEKKIILNDNKTHTKKEIIKLLHHELGTHAKRFENGGSILKIFSLGVKNYDLLEEGLATFSELKAGNILDTLYTPAIKLCSIYYALNNDFYQTMKKTIKLTKNIEISFDYTMRAKRGTYKNKGAYTKDQLYFKGFLKTTKYLLRNFYNDKAINRLLIGKISFHEIKNINKIKKIKKWR